MEKEGEKKKLLMFGRMLQRAWDDYTYAFSRMLKIDGFKFAWA